MKLQQSGRSPAWQAGQAGLMPRGPQVSQGLSTTRWPTSTPRASGPSSTTSGHHLVPGHVGERGERRHGVVHVALAEVAQHQLGVRAADAGEDRLGDHPVRPDEAGVVHLVQAERDLVEQLVDLVHRLRPGLVPVRRLAEHQCLHHAAPSPPPVDRPAVASATVASSSSCSAIARMPAKNPSMSEVFISTIAFMSGR